MTPTHLRYSKDEFAHRGDEIYERDMRSQLQADDQGKFVVIDIATGAYEIDAEEIAASDRLLARHPDAQIWLRQVDSRYARRFGQRSPASPRRQASLDPVTGQAAPS